MRVQYTCYHKLFGENQGVIIHKHTPALLSKDLDRRNAFLSS